MNDGGQGFTATAERLEALASAPLRRLPPGGRALEAERSEDVTLELLDAVQADGEVSQRSLATRLDVALGLTNAYLKRCVRRGWVKVRKVPPNRFAYFLTPTGMAEKGRLTARFLYKSFRWYRAARNQYDALLEAAAAAGQRRLVLAGAGDLAEVAMLCALRYDVEVVGVCDAEATANRFRHAALARDLASLPPADAVLLTDMRSPQATYEALAARVGPGRVLAPPLLKVVAREGGAP